MPIPSRLEGVSLQRNYLRFSIRRNCGCVGGGVRLPCVSVPSWRHFPRAWDPLVYFAGTWWGVFDSANLKTNKDAFGGLFSFPGSPLCSLHQTPSASQPPHIWYGAVGNGLSGARYVSVTLLFQCKKCTVLQAAAGIWGWMGILWRARRGLQLSNWASSAGFARLFVRICATIESSCSLVGPMLMLWGTPAQHFSFPVQRRHFSWLISL